MIVYLESSVLLRHLLGQPDAIKNWGGWREVYTGEITRVEALRVIDRLRLQGMIDDSETARCLQGLASILERIGEIPLNSKVLTLASRPFPTVVATLDAIHLAGAIAWQENYAQEMIFLTHDNQLRLAAQAVGFKVQG